MMFQNIDPVLPCDDLIAKDEGTVYFYTGAEAGQVAAAAAVVGAIAGSWAKGRPWALSG